MLRNHYHNTFAVGFCIAGSLTISSGRAEPPGMMNLLPPSRVDGTNQPPRVQVNVEASYTGASKAEFLGKKNGKSDAFSGSVNLFAPLPMNEQWIIPLGVTSQNLLLDPVAGVPIPSRINTLSFTTGLGHRINDEWMILGMFQPSIYQLSDLDGASLGFSDGLIANWRYSASLKLQGGLMISPDSDLKVFPMIGADWQINERWNLHLLFPQPRLTYQRDDHWRLHIGANMVATTFRGDATLGTDIGRPRFNHALGTYRDIRLGGGVGYEFNSTLTLEAEAGYSISRQLDYTRMDARVTFHPAPYVRLGLNARF